MDEFKIVIWIVGLVIYFLVKSRKNKSVPESQKPEFNDAPTGSKPMTFEELLREITEGKAIKPEAVEAEEVVDYETQNATTEESLGPEKQVLEKTDFDYQTQDKIYSIYEQARKDAFQQASLEDTLKLKDTDVNFGKFKEYQAEQLKPLINFETDLKNPEQLRKAIILNEILKPRF
jgi:hypothetical protein